MGEGTQVRLLYIFTKYTSTFTKSTKSQSIIYIYMSLSSIYIYSLSSNYISVYMYMVLLQCHKKKFKISMTRPFKRYLWVYLQLRVKRYRKYTTNEQYWVDNLGTSLVRNCTHFGLVVLISSQWKVDYKHLIFLKTDLFQTISNIYISKVIS